MRCDRHRRHGTASHLVAICLVYPTARQGALRCAIVDRTIATRAAPPSLADGPTRGKTGNARRAIALDDTTLAVLAAWQAFQAAEFAAVGIDTPEQWVFTGSDGDVVHPHAIYEAFRRIVVRAGVPAIRFHDLRHTHGSLLIKDGVLVNVVTERLGHVHVAHTMQTYQHLLPGMQEDAASATERLARPVPPAESDTVERRRNNS